MANKSISFSPRFKKTRAWLKSGLSLLAPKDDGFPKNESGNLMRKYMEHKNWLDKLSAWWWDKPLIQKVGFGLSFAAIGGVCGLFIGAGYTAAIGFSLFALFAHIYLNANERAKRQAARDYAQHTKVLVDGLDEGQQKINQVVNSLSEASELLTVQTNHMKEQNECIIEVKAELDKQVGQVNSAFDCTEQSVNGLAVQANALTQTMNQCAQSASQCNQALYQHATGLEGVTTAAQTLAGVAKEAEDSQKQLAQLVSNLGCFSSKDNRRASVTDSFLEKMKAQNDEADRLRLKFSCNY